MVFPAEAARQFVVLWETFLYHIDVPTFKCRHGDRMNFGYSMHRVFNSKPNKKAVLYERWPWNYFRSIPTYVITVPDHFRQTERFGRSGSSRVIDFGTNWKRICDFLLDRHSNLGHILHSFGDIAGLVLLSDPTPIPP